MGLFDTVKLECPHCGNFTEEQTKSGPCRLDVVYLDEADPSLISGLGEKGGVIYCYHCDNPFKVQMTTKPVYRTVKFDISELWDWGR